jgi:hypothetical protein
MRLARVALLLAGSLPALTGFALLWWHEQVPPEVSATVPVRFDPASGATTRSAPEGDTGADGGPSPG